MRLYRSIQSLSSQAEAGRRVATIGVFDGLHLGHREILAETRRIAKQLECASAVCSFEPMPMEYFAPESPPARLTCFRERFELLRATGIEEMFCPHFGTVRDLSPAEFVERLLVRGLGVRHIVVGHDFRYGAGRRGSFDELLQAGDALGFGVSMVEAIASRGERISSTSIRRALQAGDLPRAKEMLGRDYAMSGRVVHGLGLGRELGFPTANVNLKRRLAPVAGIFAVRVTGVGTQPIEGVASVGNRPMIGGGKTLLEVYLFSFDRDIYGEYITVHFIERLREERTFVDLEAMKQQMHIDVGQAQAALLG
jgi:riboflavin kinase/FMN adenylyltransferase